MFSGHATAVLEELRCGLTELMILMLFGVDNVQLSAMLQVCFLRNALSVITLHNFILFRNFLLNVDNQFRSQSTIMHSYKAPAHYLLNDKT